MKGPRKNNKRKSKAGAAVRSRSRASDFYACATCGIISTTKGHLCTPRTLDKAYKCEYCGALVANARHVCKPKVEHLSYVCDVCGRLGDAKGAVCVPRKIGGER